MRRVLTTIKVAAVATCLFPMTVASSNAQDQNLTLLAVSSKTPTIPFDKNFYKYTVNWQGSDGKTIILFKVVNMSGKAAVCGGYYNEGNNTTTVVSRQYMQQAYIKLGKRSVVNNLSFLTRLTGHENPDTVAMKCRGGRLTWKPAYKTIEPEVRMNGNSVEY